MKGEARVLSLMSFSLANLTGCFFVVVIVIDHHHLSSTSHRVGLTLHQLTHIRMLMYAACSTGEITISDIGIMSCFIILFVACGVLWGYFITLFWQDFEASNAGTVLLILALVIIILGSLCTNIFFWKGKAGLNCCEADNLDSAWQDDNFRERSHYEELARMQAGITDD
mmetsp:Transcript_10404/g.16673  ORF Transcript_10404/g.16673 Transcript_10404/m.16673 type:complete len:169 (-) Transcript_10404:20-526(-)